MRKIPFFKDFTIDETELILGSYTSIKRYRDKEYIIEQDHIDNSLFILLKGSVTITKNDFPGVEIKRLREGSVFGEMAILTERPRTTNVIAHHDVVILAVNGKNFEKLDMSIQIKFKNHLIEVLSNHLEEMNDLLANAQSTVNP